MRAAATARMRPGAVFDKPAGVPGRWSAWSKSDACPGAWFLVPADEAARGFGKSSITVKVGTNPDNGEPVAVRLVEA